MWEGGVLLIDFQDNEDWALGLGIPTVEGFQSGRGRFKGEGQALLATGDLEENLDFENKAFPSSGKVVGVDNRVYEPRLGLIECLAPAKVGEDSPKVYVDGVDWDSFPPYGELAYLFDNFFSHYDREVLMLVGKKRDGSGWLYHVPEQEGSCGSVEWKADDNEMGEFSDWAQWVGTIHIHPGIGCEPSQTDIDDWAEPEKSGLHLVFGRNGSYTISGAIAGRTFPLLDGEVEGVPRIAVEYTTSSGRTLEELLKKPVATVVRKKSHKLLEHHDAPSLSGFGARLDVALRWADAFPVEAEEMEDLRVISHDSRYYLMTPDQWDKVESWCDSEEIPKVRTLRIRQAKGGS